MQEVMDKESSFSMADISNYWQILGWREDPFGAVIKSTDYYQLPHWEEYLDLLQYLCLYNNVIPLVTGISGSGKTTLLQHFVSQAKTVLTMHTITAHSDMNAENLVEILSEGFHIPWQAAESLEDQFDAQLAQLQECSKNCVLIVDDAHLLPLETLQAFLFLISQQTETQMRLHIVLFGEPQLLSSLERLVETEEEQKLFQQLELVSLDLEETESYIKHRLRAVGADVESLPLNQGMLIRIYNLCGGVPGRINRVARRSLLNELSKLRDEETVGFWRQYGTKLLGGIVLIAGLLLTVFLLNHAGKTNVKSSEPKQTEPLIAFNDNKPTASLQSQQTPTANPATPQASNKTSQATDVAQSNRGQSTSGQPQNVTTVVMLPKADDASIVDNALPINTNAANSIPAETDQIPQTNVASNQQKTPVKAEPDATSIRSEAKPVPQVDEPKEQTELVTKPKHTVPMHSVAKKAAKHPAKEQTSNKSKPKVEISSAKKQLLAAKSSHYVLQLSGFAREEGAKKLIASQKLAGKAKYFHTYYRDKDWYVIVYGSYRTRQEASAAIKHLPKAVQDLKPWPRSVASVQTAIHAKKVATVDNKKKD